MKMLIVFLLCLLAGCASVEFHSAKVWGKAKHIEAKIQF